jgi:hypothetical protein
MGIRSPSVVIRSSIDDASLSPYRPGRDCGVQADEGAAVTLSRVGLLKLVHVEITTLFSLLIDTGRVRVLLSPSDSCSNS